MKYLAILGAVCAIGLSAMASQAQAAIYTFTETGTVKTGIDVKGLFGAANTDLTGQAFSVTFTWDTNDATAEITYFSGHTLRQRGTIASSEMTIGGVSYSLDVDHFGFNNVLTNGWSHYSGFSILGSTGGMDFETLSYNFFLGSDVALTGAPWSYTLTDEDRGNSRTVAYWNGDGFRFEFRPETISLAEAPPVSAVPEPTTWALMVAGFGLLGGALRARRRTVGAFA